MDVRAGRLELEEDLGAEKKLQRVRKIGWTFFTLILLAGLIGLLGEGPLSSTRAGDDRAYIEYNRFEHYAAPTELVIGFSGLAGDELEVSFPRGYLERVKIESIQPEPVSAAVTREGASYVFRAKEQGRITILIEAEKAGRAKGAVLIGAHPVELSQLFYP